MNSRRLMFYLLCAYQIIVIANLRSAQGNALVFWVFSGFLAWMGTMLLSWEEGLEEARKRWDPTYLREMMRQFLWEKAQHGDETARTQFLEMCREDERKRSHKSV